MLDMIATVQELPLDLSKTRKVDGQLTCVNMRKSPRYTIDMEDLLRTYLIISSNSGQLGCPPPAHLTSTPLAHLSYAQPPFFYPPPAFQFPSQPAFASSAAASNWPTTSSALSNMPQYISTSPFQSYPYLPSLAPSHGPSLNAETLKLEGLTARNNRQRQRRGSEDTLSEDSETVHQLSEVESKAKRRRRRTMERRRKAAQEQRRESLANACNCRFCYEDHILKLRQKAAWSLA
jgi:hypothetical protein